MVTVNFDTSNAVIVSFVPFSGGKFITNTLGLSSQCCLQDRNYAEHLFRCPTDTSFRLEKIIASLPNKTNMYNWRDHEMGDYQLYGSAHNAWSQGKKEIPNNDKEFIVRLINSNLKFFITDHAGSTGINNVLKFWPNAVIIRLINSQAFQNLSLSLKDTTYHNVIDINGNYSQEKYSELAGSEWPTWQQFELNGYNTKKFPSLPENVQKEIDMFYNWAHIDNPVFLFDIDSCIFDADKFLTAMKKLYQCLALPDFNELAILAYWNAYITLHKY